MRGVDDVGGEVDGVLGRLAGARRVAGQRIDDADLHVVGGMCRAADGDRKHCGGDGRYPHCRLPDTKFCRAKTSRVYRVCIPWTWRLIRQVLVVPTLMTADRNRRGKMK